MSSSSIGTPPSSFRKLGRHYFELTRLHKFPLGSLVIFWPAAFGVSMAVYSFELSRRVFIIQIIMFALGCTLLHSTFCILNDICDREFDGQVERTKDRPLVTGAVSVLGAWVLFFSFLAMSLFMLTFTNSTALRIGLLSLPFHLTYPLMKRWTWWPQFFLGISNSWSFPVGWLAVAGDRNSTHAQLQTVLAMYLGCVCWTIYFDTIYAAQDRADDVRVGLKSTALLFGEWIRPINSLLAGALVLFLITAGILNRHGLPYFLVACGGATTHLSCQMLYWNADDRKQSAALFRANGHLGFIIFSGILMDYAF